jgi:Putative zinc-finger
MLADVLDGTLSPADQATFDLHVAGCPSCTAMLADARRGAAWLDMLKPHRPEPSAALLDRIFAQTIGAQAIGAQTIGAQAIGEISSRTSPASQQTAIVETGRQPSTLLGVPAWTATAPALSPAAAPAVLSRKVLPFRQRFANAFRLTSIRHTLMQPRLAMTAAMAFFSIALTLNLTGVRLSQLRVSDFKPSSIKRTFYETNARVVRTFDNMRVVYELDARIRDLQQRNAENENPAPPAPAQNQQAPASQPSSDQQPDGKTPQNNQDNPDKKQAPRPKSGTSRRETPQGHLEFVGSLSSGRGIPPAAAAQAFASSSLSVFKYQQQGGLV